MSDAAATTRPSHAEPETKKRTPAPHPAPPAVAPLYLKARLEVGATADPAEHEANRIAAAVMSGAPVPAPTAGRDAAKARRSPDVSPSTAAATASMEGLGAGRPLAGETRAFMEGRFGRDLSAVRVHDGAEAGRLAKSLDARAFAYGHDIVFGGGEFRPESAAGGRLLAHELAHVAQGAEGVVRRDNGNDTAAAVEDQSRDLPIDYAKALRLNRRYYAELGLAEFAPWSPYHPEKRPVGYANETLRFQRLARAYGLDNLKGLAHDPDGILGPRTWTMLAAAALASRDEKMAAELRAAGFPMSRLTRLAARDAAALGRSMYAAYAEVTEPKVGARWAVTAPNTALWDYWRDHYLLSDRTRADFDRWIFDGPAAPGTTDEDRIAILRRAYGERELAGHAVLYEAERAYVHSKDLPRVVPPEVRPRGRSAFVYMAWLGRSDAGRAVTQLGLTIPSEPEAQRLYDRIQGGTATATGDHPTVTALLALYYLPPLPRESWQRATEAHFYQRRMAARAREEASADWLMEFSSRVQSRLAGEPDVADYDTLIALLAAPGGAPAKDPGHIARLAEKAEMELGLVVRIGDDATPFFLPWNAIRKARSQAKRNAGRPLKFGLFNEPDNPISQVGSHRFSARKTEGGVQLARAASRLTFDSSQGESGPIWSDWNLYTKHHYDDLEPVQVVISELNPNTTFWVQRYRELAGTSQWRVQHFWVLGGSLPQVSDQLWDYADTQNTIAWIDAVISVVAAASVIAGPLIASGEAALAEGALAMAGSQATIQLSKHLLKNAFWFVVTEALAQKFLDFDHAINSDTTTYDDDDRDLWNSFKIGLLVLGGTLLLRQAWKGLKLRASPAMKGSLAELEREMAKAALKGGDEAAATLGRGAVAAEARIATLERELIDDALLQGERIASGNGTRPLGTPTWMDEALGAGPTVGPSRSAVARSPAGHPYIQVNGQAMEGYLEFLRAQAAGLPAAARGELIAELDLLAARAARLEEGLRGGALKSGDAAFTTEMRAILQGLEGAAARHGLVGAEAMAAKSAWEFLIGTGKVVPTQAELDALLDEAWKVMRGKAGNRPPISLNPAITDAEALFYPLSRKIEVALKPVTKGGTASSVYHEAAHARWDELFPALSRHPTWSTYTRWLDETIAYTVGGAARVAKGRGVGDRLMGVVEIIIAHAGSPQASLTGWRQRAPLLLIDTAKFALLVKWYIDFLTEMVEKYRKPNQPTPEPPEK